MRETDFLEVILILFQQNNIFISDFSSIYWCLLLYRVYKLIINFKLSHFIWFFCGFCHRKGYDSLVIMSFFGDPWVDFIAQVLGVLAFIGVATYIFQLGWFIRSLRKEKEALEEAALARENRLMEKILNDESAFIKVP